jgi:hypothetical protein
MLVSQNESGCFKTVEDDHLCRFELPSDVYVSSNRYMLEPQRSGDFSTTIQNEHFSRTEVFIFFKQIYIHDYVVGQIFLNISYILITFDI